MRHLFILFQVLLVCASCSKPFVENQSTDGIKLPSTSAAADSLSPLSDSTANQFITRPKDVLLTSYPEHRLITVFRLNFMEGKSYYDKVSNRNGSSSFLGRTNRYHNYPGRLKEKNNAWHGHYLPGLEAIYGYNMYNLRHYNVETGASKDFFSQSVLINTVYYPAHLPDTLNGSPVKRDYYLVSVYDQDTNGDSLINKKDLRHLYHFDLDVTQRTLLLPENYSVRSSQYDLENDLLFLFASLDENQDGEIQVEEAVHGFRVDLANPDQADRVY
ncbi:MAG: hypothetical protein AAF804_01585 [Bacteroidota bacterium]